MNNKQPDSGFFVKALCLLLERLRQNWLLKPNYLFMRYDILWGLGKAVSMELDVCMSLQMLLLSVII